MQSLIARDHAVLSPSCTPGYALLIGRGEGSIVEDVDGSRFVDSNAGTALDKHNKECSKQLKDVVIEHLVPASEIAAFTVAPVQRDGGYVVSPHKFIDELQTLACRHGMLLIFHGIQCGTGRTGKMLAAEGFGAVPDIMALA